MAATPRVVADDVSGKAKEDAKDEAKADAAKAEDSKSEYEKKSNPNEQGSGPEDNIRQEAEEYCRAFRDHDARSAANHFTEQAEFVTATGETLHGRGAIESALKQCFEEGGDCRLELSIDSIRFPSSAVAIEDGTSWTVHGGTEQPVNYTAVHVKEGDTWRIASVRERASTSSHPQREKLRELDWLLGDWIDESEESAVLFSCRPMAGGNFLDRDFTVQIGDEPAMTGTQRIGWDPTSQKFRVWYFDSEGGFGEGTWSKRDSNWVLKLSGVTADGELAAGTFLYRVVSPHIVTWRALEHVVGDQSFDDGDEITMVRQSPAPRAGADATPPAPNAHEHAETERHRNDESKKDGKKSQDEK